MKDYSLLISQEQIQNRTVLNDNLDFDYVLPHLIVAQDLDLVPVLGQALTDDLMSKVKAKDTTPITEDDQTLLDDYVTPFIAYAILCRALPSLAIKLVDSGVVQRIVDDGSPLSLEDIDKMVGVYELIRDPYKQRLIDYLCANDSLYPAFIESKTWELGPSSYNYNLGIGLAGSKRSKANRGTVSSPSSFSNTFLKLLDTPSTYVGASGKVITVKATEDGLEFNVAAGGGDVSAASNFADDERLIRSNGTLKAVQASGISIDDLDNMSGLLSLMLKDGQAITWNPDFHTINIPTGTGSTLQVGQEFYFLVYNDTGVSIPNGSVVKPVAATVVGSEIIPTVKLAQADVHTNCSGTLFIATSDIANGEVGMATRIGRAGGIDTSGFSGGDDLFLSPTVPGAIINVIPEFPDYVILIGGALKIDAVDGEVAVSFTRSVEDTILNAWDGGFRESIDFLVSSDGATITGSLERSGGGDLAMIFSDGLTILDCTPPKTIVLTPGTDTVPQRVFVYILKTTKVLAISLIEFPTDEHIKVADLYLRSATATQTDDALVNRNWNDHIKMTGNNGHILHLAERLRQLAAEWNSGALGVSTIDSPTNSNVYVSATSGVIYQLHKQIFPALDTETGDHVHVVNNSAAPYIETSNLNTQILDANGDALSNFSFSIVLWGVQNKTGGQSHLMINLPTGSYAKNSPDLAVEDASNFSVYDIPTAFKGKGFLIARFTYILDAGGTDWELHETEDLRGKIPNSTAGGGGGGGTGVTEFTALTDVPSSYIGEAGKIPIVASSETAMEFKKYFPILTARTGSTLVFDDYAEYNAVTPVTSGNITLNPSGAVAGSYVGFYFIGSTEPTISGATGQLETGTFAAGILNIYHFFWNTNGEYVLNIQNTGVVLVQLSTPTVVAVAGDTIVDLTFSNIDANATINVLERSTDDISFSPVAGYNGTDLTYQDTGLTNTQIYYYRYKSQAVGYTDSNYATDNATPSSAAFDFANALSYTDGTQRVELAETFAILTGTDFTVSFWFNYNTFETAKQPINGLQFNGTGGFQSITWFMTNGNPTISSGQTITAGTRNHFVIRRVSGIFDIFVNAIKGTTSPSLPTSLLNVVLLGHASGNSAKLVYDELYMTDNYGCTDQEVADLYNSGDGVDASDILSNGEVHYHFNQSSGSVVTNDGTGADGTAVNSPTWEAF